MDTDSIRRVAIPHARSRVTARDANPAFHCVRSTRSPMIAPANAGRMVVTRLYQLWPVNPAPSRRRTPRARLTARVRTTSQRMGGCTKAVTRPKPPNGSRLSCGTEFECSQAQFYNTVLRTSTGFVGNGRRQLQARVRPQSRDRVAAREKRRDYRSEEHTSELQSRENLVCRLLLEKKKKEINGNVGAYYTIYYQC